MQTELGVRAWAERVLMHKLLECSHVSPLRAPAQPSPAPGGGWFGTALCALCRRERDEPVATGTEEEAPTSPSPVSDLPLSALTALLISTFSPLHHPMCGWSCRWSSISTRLTLSLSSHSCPRPLPRGTHPPPQSPKPTAPSSPLSWGHT